MPIPRRRRALAALVLVLVPLSLLRVLLGLLPFPGAGPARVVNGMLVLPAGVVEALVVPVGWALAVTAGIAATAHRDRPLRRTLRALPTACAALLAGVAAVLVAFLLLGLALPADQGVFWVIAALLAVPVGALLVRFALVLPIAVLDGLRGMAAFRAASGAVRGQVVSFGFSLLVGVAVPALLYGWAFARPEEHVSGPFQGVLAWLLRDLCLIAVAAVQVRSLLAVYRDLPGREGVFGAPVSEPVGVPTRGPGRRALSLGLAALLLPAALAGGVVAAERLPGVTVRAGNSPHRMIAVAWPPGRGPILVGQHEIEDCLDDRCRATRLTPLTVMMFEPYGGAAFGPDGSVYALGQQELEQCDARRVCRRAEGRLAALAGSGAAAITVSPAGEILLASATEVRPAGSAEGTARDEASHVELKLIRCPDVRCVDPAVTSLGLVDGALETLDNSPARLMIRTRRGAEPVVAFRSPSTGVVSVGWCATPDCARPQLAPFGGGRPGMPSEEELTSLGFDDVFGCPTGGCGDGGPVATVHGQQGEVYDVVIERGRREGFRLQVGAGDPTPGRVVLRLCAAHSCRDPRRIPLAEVPYAFTDQGFFPERRRWLMAVAPDGRAVISDAFANHTMMVRP
ncbi:hypothetical protein ACGFI9_07080 [Micromonospora sp. NPDC048930]|uniref:hypothetical protein n=1 Tax=Micromonospora sp. NPDC048930 TaxID=3364261 RepID=UPI003724B42F